MREVLIGQFEHTIDAKVVPWSEIQAVHQLRHLVGGDKQGRIVLPSVLRDYAGLEKDVVVIGASDRAEIWDARRWAADNEDLTSDPPRSSRMPSTLSIPRLSSTWGISA